MSGIYVHIPFCKVKCHYCDFHFSTNSSNSDEMVDAICAELAQRSEYLTEQVGTIYFGGGTPSFIAPAQLDRILGTIYKHFNLSEYPEITIECNPDDLNDSVLKALKDLQFNRLSIGVQSFDDEVLKMMNRAHSAAEALKSVRQAQDIGFENITIDLMYGIPDRNLDYWDRQLDRIIDLQVPHISAYCLTIEPKTVFGHQFRYGNLEIPSDEDTLDQFKQLIFRLERAGFVQYEISNFAKDGFLSQHNAAYWLGKSYLGVGPSAHSYNGLQRGWNIANNHAYIKKVFEGEAFHETEELSSKDKFNDYVLTRLRTHWGLDLNEINQLGRDLNLTEFKRQLNRHLDLQNVIRVNNVIRLSELGKFIADGIAADLFM